MPHPPVTLLPIPDLPSARYWLRRVDHGVPVAASTGWVQFDPATDRSSGFPAWMVRLFLVPSGTPRPDGGRIGEDLVESATLQVTATGIGGTWIDRAGHQFTHAGALLASLLAIADEDPERWEVVVRGLYREDVRPGLRPANRYVKPWTGAWPPDLHTFRKR